MTPSPPPPWLLLQLADASFPSGGFAHSSGLEAALALGGVGADPDALARWVDHALVHGGYSSLPFVVAACEAPLRLADLEDAIDAQLLSHVANRASRAQGRALASAAKRIFEPAPGSALEAIASHAKDGLAHHAPIFGAIFGALGLPAASAGAAFLHGHARGLLSAAIRLGALGPLEAQRMHADRAPLLDHILATCSVLDVADAASTAPLAELFGALHDRLDGHLFQS